jgi:hypothetical protein
MSSTRDSRRRQRGVALILTLWSFMVLGVLSLDFGRWMREDAMAGANFAEETQGYYAAYAGMQTALWKARLRLVNGSFGGDDDGGGGDGEDEQLVQSETGTFHGIAYEVEARPECGRIPINRIAIDAGKGEQDDQEFLKRLFTNLLQGGNAAEGIDDRGAKEIDQLVDAVIDWVDQDSTQRLNGAETKWYRANRGYPARNGPLVTVEELLQIRGVTPELFYGTDERPGLRDVVSVFCGFNQSGQFQEGMIDGESVDPKVVGALLPTAQEDDLADLESLRTSGDRVGFASKLQSLVGADPILESKFEFQPDRATLVAVAARADTARERNQSAIAGVFVLEANDVPEPVIWYDRAPFTGVPPRSEFPEGGE